jgi:hypothetical protein
LISARHAGADLALLWTNKPHVVQFPSLHLPAVTPCELIDLGRQHPDRP